MRKLFSLIAGGLLLAGAGTAVSAATPADHEAELARALDGLVAGEPVDCIDLHRVQSTRIINDTAILYDAGRTLYVNRPRGGADSLNRWDTIVTRLHSRRLCSIDTVQMIDPNSRILTGVVFLGDFVPYRREESAQAD